jgi:hypothetical protein
VANTLEMTRTILKNAGGEEKSVDELRQLIRTTYRIEPASRWTRCSTSARPRAVVSTRRRKGKFGLTEQRTGVAIRRRAVVLSTVV